MKHATTTAGETSSPASQGVPEKLPMELLPVYDWWKANGSQFMVTLLTAAILFGGAFAFVEYRASKTANANKALLQASSLEDLESVVAQYGSSKAGNAARLRLGKAYFDAANYEAALSTYEACLQKGAPDGFVEIAQLGRAHSLEALNRLDEALAAYEDFDKNAAGHFLQPQAKLGIARIYTLQGKKDDAKKLLETLKAQETDDPTWEMTVANLEGVIDRYEPHAQRSLFEAANAAAAQSAASGKAPAAMPTTPLPVPAPAAPAPAAAK